MILLSLTLLINEVGAWSPLGVLSVRVKESAVQDSTVHSTYFKA